MGKRFQGEDTGSKNDKFMADQVRLPFNKGVNKVGDCI